MGFSFRSLYTDDDQPEQRAVLGSLPATPAMGRPSASQAVASGIPGPLKGSEPVRSAFRRAVDDSVFISLDELEPAPVVEEAPNIPHVEAVPFVAAPAVSAAPVPEGKGSGEAEITLRAIFATSDPFTLKRVAILTARLPGVISCIIQTSESSILAMAETGDVSVVSSPLDLLQPRVFQQSLDLLGLGKTEGLMLRTETGPASYFSFAGISLIVRHSSDDLEPGLWEKMILITQASAEMSFSA